MGTTAQSWRAGDGQGVKWGVAWRPHMPLIYPFRRSGKSEPQPRPRLGERASEREVGVGWGGVEWAV